MANSPAADYDRKIFLIMGKRAQQVRRETRRTLRSTRLDDKERAFLRTHASYEGSPHHKRNPGDFGLTPPSAPRADKTLCDEAAIFKRALANDLFGKAIDAGLVSEATSAPGFPKQLWVVDDQGRVFEAMYGGSVAGHYHGYPIRRADPLFERIQTAWQDQ